MRTSITGELPSSQYTGNTYQLTQPTDDPDVTARRSEGFDVLDETHFEATTATVAYYQPETLTGGAVDFRDDLYDERYQQTGAFECDKSHIKNTGEVVTTTLEPGDVFFLGSRTGLYEYVGITNQTEDRGELLVFEPANQATRTKDNHNFSKRTTAYQTYYKSDFAHKFSPYPIQSDRHLTIIRIDTDLYDDLSRVTEFHEIPPHPDPTNTNPTTDSEGESSDSDQTVEDEPENATESRLQALINTPREVMSSIRRSIRNVREADPGTESEPEPEPVDEHDIPASETGVVAHTVHTDPRTTEMEPETTHTTVYQTKTR